MTAGSPDLHGTAIIDRIITTAQGQRVSSDIVSHNIRAIWDDQAKQERLTYRFDR